jgi:putative sterol carrier protein
MITAAWGVVFTAQAISGATSLALGLQGTVRILLVAIIPRILLIGAIAFTAWFPKWYPARAVARQTRRNAASRPSGMTGLELIQSMPLAFDAQAAGDRCAVIQFDLSGEGGGTGYLKIEAGRCAFHTGRAEQSTLTIAGPAHVWVTISEGRMSGAEALMNGVYTATGDLGMLMQLERLFSRHGSTL